MLVVQKLAQASVGIILMVAHWGCGRSPADGSVPAARISSEWSDIRAPWAPKLCKDCNCVLEEYGDLLLSSAVEQVHEGWRFVAREHPALLVACINAGASTNLVDERFRSEYEKVRNSLSYMVAVDFRERRSLLKPVSEAGNMLAHEIAQWDFKLVAGTDTINAGIVHPEAGLLSARGVTAWVGFEVLSGLPSERYLIASREQGQVLEFRIDSDDADEWVALNGLQQ